MSTSHQLRHYTFKSRCGFIAVSCDIGSSWSQRRPGAIQFVLQPGTELSSGTASLAGLYSRDVICCELFQRLPRCLVCDLRQREARTVGVRCKYVCCTTLTCSWMRMAALQLHVSECWYSDSCSIRAYPKPYQLEPSKFAPRTASQATRFEICVSVDVLRDMCSATTPIADGVVSSGVIR
jgi:hypothetical protein